MPITQADEKRLARLREESKRIREAINEIQGRIDAEKAKPYLWKAYIERSGADVTVYHRVVEVDEHGNLKVLRFYTAREVFRLDYMDLTPSSMDGMTQIPQDAFIEAWAEFQKKIIAVRIGP